MRYLACQRMKMLLLCLTIASCGMAPAPMGGIVDNGNRIGGETHKETTSSDEPSSVVFHKVSLFNGAHAISVFEGSEKSSPDDQTEIFVRNQQQYLQLKIATTGCSASVSFKTSSGFNVNKCGRDGSVKHWSVATSANEFIDITSILDDPNLELIINTLE